MYLSGGPDVIPSTFIAGRADLALTTPDTTIKAIVDQGAPRLRSSAPKLPRTQSGIIVFGCQQPSTHLLWSAKPSPCHP
jgi:hypothetical protein